MLQRVEKKSLSDNVFEQLREEIVSGRMVAGSSLPSERALCALLGVNRGALREALKRLEEARLVSIRHGGKTTVLDFRARAGMGLLETLLLTADGQVRMKVARAIVEMRTALAPDIARLAAQRAGSEQLRQLEQALEQMRKADGDLKVIQFIALDFWDVLVNASDNLAYRLAYNSLRDGYLNFIDLLTDVLAPELGNFAGYEAIAAAVVAHDGAAAHAAAATQIGRGGDALSRILEQLIALEGGAS
jgi:DNA-binding FadR family transcriptional regulator